MTASIEALNREMVSRIISFGFGHLSNTQTGIENEEEGTEGGVDKH